MDFIFLKPPTELKSAAEIKSWNLMAINTCEQSCRIEIIQKIWMSLCTTFSNLKHYVHTFYGIFLPYTKVECNEFKIFNHYHTNVYHSQVCSVCHCVIWQHFYKPKHSNRRGAGGNRSTISSQSINFRIRMRAIALHAAIVTWLAKLDLYWS